MIRRYTAEELQTLLLAIDEHLIAPAEIILIGGAAALLEYHATRLTSDVDTWNDTNHVEDAYQKAKEQTNLDILLSKAAVADAPYNFEDRLKTYDEVPLRNLIVRVPEVYDLILMKTLRGYEHDLDVIQEIIQKNDVHADVLIQRFETEMDHVIGHGISVRTKFAAVLARCFGDEVAEDWINGQPRNDKSESQ